MFRKFFQSVHLESPGEETISATRERLRDILPRAAARRMTQLGMLVTNVLAPTKLTEADTLVYASEYGESHALEEYLASFPTPSPTLFQTSIHPSAVQQAMIARQQPIQEFWPHAGGAFLAARAIRTALLAPAERCVFCGGEERGTWLREYRVASDETFAFAITFQRESESAIGSLTMSAIDDDPASNRGSRGLPLRDFFSALRERRALQLQVAPALMLEITWH